ncbi:FAD:protein FMN transferase [Rathayibacter soli]|uniref:FAD:protein FMN transferase n=1 Tax=Rathayibacter soli TaxID=3144168 RepID=UPI0027E543A5|nr:FAD:protein FMN transferase [Glaciibacter superstes]
MPIAESATALEFEALGTRWYVDAAGGLPHALRTSIAAELERVDAVWSRFRADSMVSSLARDGGSRTLAPHHLGLLRWYARLYDATDGAVTPLIGQTLSDAGYDAAVGLRPRPEIATTPAWDHRSQLRARGIALDRPLLFDVGAAGKGYAVDRVADLIRAAGIDAYIVDGGGDIAVGTATHLIGLEHPIWPDRLIGTARISGGDPAHADPGGPGGSGGSADAGGSGDLGHSAICGSATNRRAWGDWHHILNPRTSRPTTEVIAAWAIADSAMHADGLATALFFVPPGRLAHLGPFDYIVVHGDGTIERTDSAALTIFDGDAA